MQTVLVWLLAYLLVFTVQTVLATLRAHSHWPIGFGVSSCFDFQISTFDMTPYVKNAVFTS